MTVPRYSHFHRDSRCKKIRRCSVCLLSAHRNVPCVENVAHVSISKSIAATVCMLAIAEQGCVNCGALADLIFSRSRLLALSSPGNKRVATGFRQNGPA